MPSKRKSVYTVTLHEEVAEWFRGLASNRKLSSGLARAQALLVQHGVRSSPESHFRTATSIAPTAAELDRIEGAAFAESEAAYRAGKPLPDHHHLMGKGLGRIRQRVLERCETAFGWRYGPVPPGIVLPTDNPFGDEPPKSPAPPTRPSADEQIDAAYQQWLAEQRQEATGDAGGSEGTATEPPPEPESIVESIERDRSQGPMDQGTTAPAAPAASTADVTGTEPPAPSAGNLPGEPTF